MRIEMNKVGKTIKGTQLLKDICLQMESGSVYGFVGDNGSGKTVLFKVLMGLMKKTEGSILVDGKEQTDLLQDVGFILERPNFIPYYSAMKNLKTIAAYRRIADDSRLKEVLEQVGLDPNDKKKVGKYSLGMKQKLALAMALMEHPSVLILDEPLNALDENAVSMARELILKERERGALVMIASHYAADIDYLCDKVYRMQQGKLMDAV